MHHIWKESLEYQESETQTEITKTTSHFVPWKGKLLKMAIEIDLVGQWSQVITQIKEIVEVFNTMYN